MTRLRLSKTNFTAGEIGPTLLGRGDLTAYQNGAAKLRNVFVQPTGGVTRRAGTRFVAKARRAFERLTEGGTMTMVNGGSAAVAADGDWLTATKTTTPLSTTNGYEIVRAELSPVRTIDTVDLVGVALDGATGPADLQIQVSDDGVGWTDFGPAVSITDIPASARRSISVPTRFVRAIRTGTDDLGSATVSLAGFHLHVESEEIKTGRLVAFEFNVEQTYLLVFTEFNIAVYADDLWVSDIPSPFSAEQIAQIGWAQSADTLLVTHPAVPPKLVTRNLVVVGGEPEERWRIEDWRFIEEETREGGDNSDKSKPLLGYALQMPFYKFADADVTLDPSGTARDANIDLVASAPDFDAAHVGMHFRPDRRQVRITGVRSPTQATALVREKLQSGDATKDWEEPAFSILRGWPTCVGFHQDRLVIGGSRDLPNRLWLSKSSDLFNFDLGEGLDDNAVEFAILSDQVNAIRHVFSGRHLQVMTSGAEWMVTGDPLTPGNIQLKRQTRVGSLVDRTVPPKDVDGGTLFVSRSGDALREFLFTDVEQAYQANDLALLAKHMIVDPVDQDYDQKERLFHVVLSDGTISTVTVYRAEQVTAWSRQSTPGAFRSVAVVDGRSYLMVERAGGLFLERFDRATCLDSAHLADAGSPTDVWDGLDHLDGQTVSIVGDGEVLSDNLVSGGQLQLETQVSAVEIGLPVTMEVEPLPLVAGSARGPAHGLPVRLIRATFRLLETKALVVDAGQGLRPVPFKRLGEGLLDTGPPAFSGDKVVRAMGWRRGAATPVWRVEQAVPLPCTILGVTTEIKIND